MASNDYRHTASIVGDARDKGASIGKVKVKRAIAIAELAKKGLTTKEAATKMGMDQHTIERYSRQFTINFSDYSPRAFEYKPGVKRKRMARIKLSTGVEQ